MTRVYAGLMLTALLVAASAATAEEAPTPCSLGALNLDADPDFAASVRRYFPTESRRTLSCKVASQQTLTADGLSLRFHVAEILNDGQFQLDSNIIVIERLDGEQAHRIGHVVLPPDPLDGATRFEPQLVRRDGAVLIRLSPRHPRIYRLDGDRLVAIPAFDWREKLDLYPGASRGGQALGLDLERMEGRIALTPDASSSGPPSAFATPKIGLARLALKDDRLTIVASEAVERKTGEYPFLDKVMAEEEEERAAAGVRPAGVEPCSFGAWSADTDRKGLNVRAEPSAKAKILGVAPPPRVARSEEGAFGSDPIAAEFRVLGFREGWFLIDDIKAPGVPYGIAYPKTLPQPYKGSGWVAGNLIGAAPANRGMPVGRLYQAPYAEARFEEASIAVGSEAPVARILACSGTWALIETKDGHRGWTRTLCSNQATNCS